MWELVAAGGVQSQGMPAPLAPPAAPPLALAGSVFADITHLMHFDGSWADAASSNADAVRTATVGASAATDCAAGNPPCTGKYNGAVVFDGSDTGYVKPPLVASEASKGPWSMFIWIKGSADQPGGNSDHTVIFSRYHYVWELIVKPKNDGNGQNLFWQDDCANSCPTINANTVVFDDTWHHVGVTVDAAHVVTVYVDGDAKASGTAVHSLDAGDDRPLTLGMRSTNNQHKFAGKMDEFAYWPRALLPSEVLSVFSATQALPDPTPRVAKSIWHFDNSYGDAISSNDGVRGASSTAAFTFTAKAGGHAIGFTGGGGDTNNINLGVLNTDAPFTLALWLKGTGKGTDYRTAISSSQYAASHPPLALVVVTNLRRGPP